MNILIFKNTNIGDVLTIKVKKIVKINDILEIKFM